MVHKERRASVQITNQALPDESYLLNRPNDWVGGSKTRENEALDQKSPTSTVTREEEEEETSSEDNHQHHQSSPTRPTRFSRRLSNIEKAALLSPAKIIVRRSTASRPDDWVGASTPTSRRRSMPIMIDGYSPIKKAPLETSCDD